MKKRLWASPFLFFLIASILISPFSGKAEPPSRPAIRPNLVLLIIVDGLSAEEWNDIQPLLGEGGLRRLKTEGASLTNAHYSYATTVTAAGHATLATGASPAQHGLIGNEWMDSQSKEEMYCVEDASKKFLSPDITKKHDGTSPRNLKVNTLGDELISQTGNKSRVFALSGKDRAAILTGGKKGMAYFLNRRSGRFVTSDYYRENYPDWWTDFHRDLPQNKWFGAEWTPLLDLARYKNPETAYREYHINFRGLGRGFPHKITGGLTAPGPHYYAALTKTPYSDEYLSSFAKAAIKGEGIGRNPSGFPDLLILSFSSHDLVNHSFGPESVQSQDNLLRLDRTLADLFRFLDNWVPEENRVTLFTADHGFEKTPEFLALQGLPSGRINVDDLKEALNKHLSSVFGGGNFIQSWYLPTFYFNKQTLRKKKIPARELEKAAAEFLLTQEGIASVFTRTAFMKARLPENETARMAAKAWDKDRSGDLFLVPEEGWHFYEPPNRVAATHGSPYPADTHVPLIFWGSMFKKGAFDERVDIEDLVPTLAAVLEITPPKTAEGKALAFIRPE